MAIPELNKRVTVKKVSYVSDGIGGVTGTVSTSDIWAYVQTQGGNFNAQFSSGEAQVKYKFTVRKRSGNVYNTKSVINYSGSDYIVLYVDSGDFGNEYITLVCELKNQ